MLTPRGAVWLTGLVEDVAAGVNGGEEAVSEIAKAAERSIALCSVQNGVVREHTSISGVEHDCAGAGPVAWSLLSLVHLDNREPWEAYDTVTSDGRVFTLAVSSASPPGAAKIVQASHLFEAGLSSLASSDKGVKQDAKLGQPENSLAAGDGSLETEQNPQGATEQAMTRETPEPRGTAATVTAPTREFGQSSFPWRLRTILMSSAFAVSCLIFGLVVGIQMGNLRSRREEAKAPAVGVDVPGSVEPEKPAERVPRAGETRLNPKDGLAYVWLPAGEFQMGCIGEDALCDADERPVHKVRFSRGFWMGQTEVTFEAYRRFVSALGIPPPEAPPLDKEWRRTTSPVVNVSWKDASTFCHDSGGRLPTEAEWEYAARGAAEQDDLAKLTERAWIASNSGSSELSEETLAGWFADLGEYKKRLDDNQNVAHAVGKKRATGYGFFDILGNVWEWCEDWFDPQYYAKSSSSVAIDPHGPDFGDKRILRGGSYKALERHVRVSNRNSDDPDSRSPTYGFRCVVQSIE